MVAIIPARGDSKRLPKKNTKLLCGKPLIAYSIEAAKESKHIERIIVSTDSKDIADVAIAYGAEIPFMRPNELATDGATSADVFCYTIDRLNKESNATINEFIVLQPTSPLRTAFDIDTAIDIYYKKNADSVISITETSFLQEWVVTITPNGSLKNYLPGDKEAPRLQHQKIYIPNGSIYVLQFNILKKNGSYYTNNTYPYIMPAEASVDIDTLADFEYAEFLIQKRIQNQKAKFNL